jgi:hypothetical protein
MAATKTIQFLPEVFRTDTNRKFLNATVDQLVSEPNFKKVNGYIGRKLAPSYKNTDSYIEEPTTDRQNYQLEPGIVIRNPTTDQIEFASTYTDIINKIGYYGGLNNRHTRLFDSEYYSYDPKIDLDKFVNFSQYFWLENGPDSVTVSATNVPLNYTFDVFYDSITGSYKFTGYENSLNPTITLARGGIYNFVINDPSNQFYIQTNPGVNGVNPNLTNISSRDVLGVANNGQDVGTVTFTVPTLIAQSEWTSMTTGATVDYATKLSYQDLQGSKVSELNSVLGGFDGTSTSIDLSKLIFINNEYIDDAYWVNTARVDENNIIHLDANELIAFNLRNNTYLIQIFPDANGDERLYLSPLTNIIDEQKIKVLRGEKNVGKEFYSRMGLFNEIPLITAPLELMYYQSATYGSASGSIEIIDIDTAEIDPATQIEGQIEYTSPNGITFTNGLKITFDSSATEEYRNKTYYVDGVGLSIQLVLVDNLISPELNNNLSVPDYITIKRSSFDQNGWSRSNRWFHLDVIEKTAAYNETDLILDQNLRAKRPIIEFDENINLYKFGTEAKNPIEILDTIVTNAYTQIQGVICFNTVSHTFEINGQSVTLTSGERVVFSVDENNDVRNKIYLFSIQEVTRNIFPPVYKAIIEETSDTLVGAGNTVLVKSGDNGSTQWHYNGSQWIKSQQKTAVNQAPLFDVINSNGVSFGDPTTYPGTNFEGTKIFAYKEGTGTNDPVLGFPLSYKNFIAQGDIQFENTFDTDTFRYLISGGVTETVKVNSGLLQKNITRTASQRANIWTINQAFSKQFQVYDFIYDGVTNLFPIDYLPDASTTVPNIKVVVNNTALSINDIVITRTVNKLAILVNPDLLTTNDAVFISVHSSYEVSANAYYEVPLNLDINSLNSNLSTLTLGQLRNHLITLKNNNLNITGAVPGNSNIRDIVYKDTGGSILQHSAPVIYSGLFLNHPTMNFVDGIKLATREYSQFKIKFLELAANLQIDREDISGSVDTIISTINQVKNETFPWHFSDMVPYGENERVALPTYTIFDPDIRGYEITSIFQDTVVSNKSVFVYLTRTLNNVTTKTLLVKDHDYYFDQTRPAVVFLDTFELLYDDLIDIVEYNNTNGSYVPETPTKLGLYPKFVPEIYLDNTYRQETLVIQGHDGSITPAFGDFRDNLLLELERRIYNNIKTTYDITLFNIDDYVPGKFRLTDYSRQEFAQILSNSFLTWVGSNRIDYTTNSTFAASDAFTWNYKKFRDVVNGESLPGTWRSIYRYFYDTDRPHTHPWEMLGFSEKPAYWEDRYGPAPYTGGNRILWSDLEIGYIHAGSRAGIDTRYQRLNLSSFIPVDDSGNLISPEKILVTDFDSAKANTSYAVGDIGPAELAWRRSSDYPFAVQQALALSKPAKYFALLVDTQSYYRSRVTSQFVTDSTNQHLNPASIRVNGYTSPTGVVERTAGYLNWICDYVKSLGVIDSAALIKENLAAMSVQLTYKVGGYTDKRFLNLLAEQSSPSSINDSVVIPDENYRLELYKGAPVNKITYSGVIIERSAGGYTISGFDLTKPYFFIIPSQPNNNAYTITVGARRGVIYKDFKQAKYTIPYGFEFNTTQQVVDFLVSYQRYLTAQGFVFNDRDNDLKEQKDWILSAKEFLHWTSQGWGPGSILVLSPISNVIKVYDAEAIVDEVKNTPYGSRVLDINYRAIRKNNFTVLRESNLFTFTSNADQTIGYAEFDLIQYEHLLILDNATVFQDIIYVPELGNRQYRLKLVGSKTAGWNGSLELPGFIYSSSKVDSWSPGQDYLKGSIVANKGRYYTALENISAADQFQITQWKQVLSTELKSGVVNNFATNSGQGLNFYDVDNQPINESLQMFSNGLIGFRDRSYFTNLGIDATTQTKFYQGLITQKGTVNSIRALRGAKFNNLNTSIDFVENWAIRVGEYGSIEVNDFTEVVLLESNFDNNPAVLQLGDSTTTEETDIVLYGEKDIYKSAGVFKANIFKTVDNTKTSTLTSLPVAGFVNLDDVDATIFNINDYATLTTIVNQIGTGYKIWVAKDFNNEWNVYRASSVPGLAFAMRYNLDDVAEIIVSDNHGLASGDIVALKNFDARFNGVYQVTEIVDSQRFYITMFQNLQELIAVQSVIGSGLLLKLTSVKIEYPSQVDSIVPNSGWLRNDKVWVNDTDGNQTWGVYTLTDPWEYQETFQLGEGQYVGKDHFGRSVKLTPDALYMYAGAPDSGYGRVSIYTRSRTDTWSPYGGLWGNNASLKSFGKAIVTAGTYVIISAPDTASKRGCVYVYKDQILMQIITDLSGTANYQFGYSMALSDNSKYLYIGSPGANRVDCYFLVTGRKETAQIIFGDGINNVFTLNDVTTDANEVIITSPLRSSEYIPGVDYTISGTTLTFTTIPENFEKIAIVRRLDRYVKIGSLPTGSESVAGNNFGSSLVCNSEGSVIAVGADKESAGLVENTGAVYVYHRTITDFVTDGQIGSFITPDNLNTQFEVVLSNTNLVQGTDFYTIGTNVIQFPNFAPPASAKYLRVHTNQFVFDQKITPEFSGLLGSRFGSGLAICNTGCNIYITSPQYRESNYNFGLVTRYINPGRVYGTVTGTITNPTVTIGHTLIINNRSVKFSGTTLDSVVKDINAQSISGVTASVVDNKLQIDSVVVQTGNKLDIKAGVGSALADLGIGNFVYAQIIKHPTLTGEIFGSSIAVDQTTGTLAVGSDGADLSLPVKIDSTLSNSTIFDSGGTNFTDVLKDSGAVYLYSLMTNPYETLGDPSLFAYTQKLIGPNIDAGFNFGAAIDIVGKFIVAGVSNDYNLVNEGGSLYLYYNKNSKSGWELSRYKEPRVDPTAVSSTFIYNNVTRNIIDYFDILDPVKGKLLGVVDQELDYKEDFDPASYNSTNTASTIQNTSFYWTSEHVGRTWWDLTNVRFIDYEQGSLQYRSKNWGNIFPGSQIKIYEWVESDVLPSQYTGNGIPKYPDNSAYSIVTQVDPATGIISQKYYFWVGSKTEVDVNIARRTLSTSVLESYILDPKGQNIPYVGLLAPNSVAVYNATDSLVSDQVVLHVDSTNPESSNLMHNEWQLVQEGSGTATIPSRIINKIRESLVGADLYGVPIPNPRLRVSERIGIMPLQSIVNNRLAALQIFVDTVNTIFVNYPILLITNPSQLYGMEDLPTVGFDQKLDNSSEIDYLNTNLYPDGYTILVPIDANYNGKWTLYKYNATTSQFELRRIQSYKTDLQWQAIDWYSSSYISGKVFSHVLYRYSDTQALTLVAGEYIKILDGGRGTWLVYEVLDDLSLNLIAAESATVKLDVGLYDTTTGSGYDSAVFDSIAYDPQATLEFSSIFNSVYEEIFIDDLAIEFNNLFFNIINYIFTEQKSLDWIFKTSFIDVYHQLRTLEQIPNYVKDDQNFYQDYINEVKPYRTQLKEYIPTYSRIDTATGDWTDFDLPSQFDPVTRTFRSPDISNPADTTKFTADPYQYWADNYKFKITNFTLANVGQGYTIKPSIEITGGGGSGATAEAIINAGTGQITNVVVTNTGSGYTSTPTITVNGIGEGAIVYPLLKNEYFSSNANLSYNLVRDFKTTLRFDRYSYLSNVKIWQPRTAYSNTVVRYGDTTGSAANLWLASGDIVVYNNEAFLATNANVTTQSLFDYTRFTKLAGGNVLMNSVDRIRAFYQPTSGMPGADPSQLMSGLEYPGINVFGPKFRANTFQVTTDAVSFNWIGLTISSNDITKVDFDRLGFEIDQSILIEANYGFNFQNNGYFKIVNVSRDSMTLTGKPIETTYKLLLSKPITANAGDLITQDSSIASAYALESVVDSQELSIVYSTPGFQIYSNVVNVNGSYTTANVLGVVSGGNANVTISYLNLQSILDSNVYSTYLDTALGTRPEDINITGSAYVDTYSSHAPEELIPGRVYDTLEMRVFTNVAANTYSVGYRIFHPMSGNVEYTRIDGNATTTLSANLNINDKTIEVDNIDAMPEPNPVRAVPGVIFINGERIHYYRKYDAARLSTAQTWAANTIFALDTLISYDSNVYLTLGNIYANSSTYLNTANLELIRSNTLAQLRRGVNGTGSPNVHVAGTRVVDSSVIQTIKGDTNNTTWLNMTGAIADGTGLEGSITESAAFIKAKASYNP